MSNSSIPLGRDEPQDLTKKQNKIYLQLIKSRKKQNITKTKKAKSSSFH